MECIIFLIVGFTIGFIFCMIFKRRDEVHGKVEIEPSTGLCRFIISSDEIANPNKKYAVFKISHNAIISRDEQWL